MALTFTASARGIGMLSAVGTVAVSVVYAVTLIAGLLSIQSPQHPIGDPLFAMLEIEIIVMMPLMVVLMLAVHAWARAEAKESFESRSSTCRGVTVNARSNRCLRALAVIGLLGFLAFAPCAAEAQSNAPAAVDAKIIRVQVLGSVWRPGTVELNDGDRLTVALARAWIGESLNPDLSRIILTRIDPTTGKNVSYVIDLYQALRRGDQRFNPILSAGDKIFVLEVRSKFPVQIQIATP